jgi:hypothetical protein
MGGLRLKLYLLVGNCTKDEVEDIKFGFVLKHRSFSEGDGPKDSFGEDEA